MRRFLSYSLTIGGLLLLLLSCLLTVARRHPSNAYWLLMSVDEGSQQQLVKMSPAGGRLFPITPQWWAFEVLGHLEDDDWLYLAHYLGEYDADGRERAELIRVSRADLHYESFGWLSVSESLTPMPDGNWLITNVSYQTTGFYRLRRDGQGRELIFRFDDPNLSIPTYPVVVFSPDGQWMYFNVDDKNTSQFGVYRVRLDGTQLTNLTPPTEHFMILLNWPPTSEWLFVERGARDRHIYMLGTDGAAFIPLITTSPVTGADQVGWIAPDVMIVREYKTGELWAMQTDGRGWQITPYVQSVKQLPSGEIIMASAGGIARLNGDGTHDLIAPMDNLSLLYFIETPPHSDWVYYFEQGVNARYSEALKRLNLKSGEIETLVNPVTGFSLQSFAPDGTWMVFRAIMDSQPGLYRVNADGSGLYRVTGNYSNPSFVGFGPPIDKAWSAPTFFGGGALLCIFGIVSRRRGLR